MKFNPKHEASLRVKNVLKQLKSSKTKRVIISTLDEETYGFLQSKADWSFENWQAINEEVTRQLRAHGVAIRFVKRNKKNYFDFIASKQVADTSARRKLHFNILTNVIIDPPPEPTLTVADVSSITDFDLGLRMDVVLDKKGNGTIDEGFFTDLDNLLEAGCEDMPVVQKKGVFTVCVKSERAFNKLMRDCQPEGGESFTRKEWKERQQELRNEWKERQQGHNRLLKNPSFRAKFILIKFSHQNLASKETVSLAKSAAAACAQGFCPVLCGA